MPLAINRKGRKSIAKIKAFAAAILAADGAKSLEWLLMEVAPIGPNAANYYS